MEPPSSSPPWWHSLSHQERYRKLNQVREIWCRRLYKNGPPDRSGLTIHLDGTWIEDVPSFHLALGDAINGRYGYFGGCLDALSDCLNRGFGVLAPLTVYLSHYDKVRDALDGRAWCRFDAEIFQEDPEGYMDGDSPDYVARWTAIYHAALAGEPFECPECDRSYFDVLLEVFARGGAELLPLERADS
jgi:RNAse (barnase) inhibitor barstar